MRVTVVGTGFVGATVGMRLAEQERTDEVVLIDVIDGLPQAVALDIGQSMALGRSQSLIYGTNNYTDTSESDIVVITAGITRRPGTSRMDLLKVNAEIVGSVTREITTYSPNAVIIVVTNPLDEMTFVASEISGFPRERVVGMAGILDSSRFRYFIAQEIGVSIASVEALTLGSHGEDMVPLPRHAMVNGTSLIQTVDEDTLSRLILRTRDAGAEIGRLLKTGSAYYAPSASVATMVNAVANDTREVLPVCAWCTGQYGISGVYLGVPARLGRGGVQEIVQLNLNQTESLALRTAAEGIKTRLSILGHST